VLGQSTIQNHGRVNPRLKSFFFLFQSVFRRVRLKLGDPRYLLAIIMTAHEKKKSTENIRQAEIDVPVYMTRRIFGIISLKNRQPNLF